MYLYLFKTFRTAYYFPAINDSQSFLYGLYTPYGLIAKIYWWMFRHLSIVRFLNRVDSSSLCFPYEKIVKLMPEGCILSFNLGTPGDGQKISMLGVDLNKERFFAKYSEKPGAVSLSSNEIKILTELRGRNIAPELLDYKFGKGFCFFRTSFAEGEAVTTLCLNKEIVDLAISVSKIHMGSGKGDLLTGLSHGDFAPWNMLVNDDVYRLIDWEMAEERSLGFDLFYFIYHVGRLFYPNELISDRINTNKVYINQYFNAFGVENWCPYYNDFMLRLNILQ